MDASEADRRSLVDLNVLIDSNVILVSSADNVSYNIEQVFKREQTADKLVVEQFGSWSPDSGMEDVRESRVLARRRRDLMGMHFIISTVIIHNDSLNHLTDRK